MFLQDAGRDVRYQSRISAEGNQACPSDRLSPVDCNECGHEAASFCIGSFLPMQCGRQKVRRGMKKILLNGLFSRGARTGGDYSLITRLRTRSIFGCARCHACLTAPSDVTLPREQLILLAI